ncbi:response regulator [Rhodoplanes sp. Z2-YC6860]|uniref:response regulator n=1 Tax=Rhodoplanes sp. Z2-YC6860 TaxID=674703 RepID=UPI00078EB1E0|nr:response regulator [Rhodoplanes sp. Z2-YC6860]AMN43148.1 response regulator receiver domain-containing protein [Rhodoplanes sp. Z2-YC6860]
MTIPAGDKVTVLIVEDDPLLLLNAIDFLEDAGFRTLTAVNADAAIRLLEARNDICIVFTDVDMPGTMNGVKLAAAVRDRWPPVAIVVTSGIVTSPDLPKGSRFFAKPFEPQRVVDAMMEMIV